MKTKEGLFLFGRYLILVLLGFFKLKLFYLIFTPLTVYPVFGVLSIVHENARLFPGNLLFFGGFYAEIIPACVAGAAYYLLIILNLTTPMEIGKRVKSILFVLATFLVLNVMRILIFSALLFSGYQYFDLTHKLTWYYGSTLIVVLVWFASTWLFKIREIPVYTDMRRIFNDITSYKDKKLKTRNRK